MRSNKGFTLVEMAIVLIIIGIILGAVVKGQDLITNAKSKKVTTTVNAWSALIFAYMDRTGRFPGDGGRNGIIGDNLVGFATESTTAAAMLELTAANTGMYNAPTNPIIVGGQSFYIYPGYVTIPAAGAIPASTKNALVVCPDSACGRVMTTDEMQVIQTLDTSLDGAADAGTGQVRAITAATLAPAAPVAVAANGNRFIGTLTAATIISTTSAGALNTVWNVTTHRGAVWLFDKPF